MLCIHIDADDVLRKLNNYFKLKHGSLGDPDLYPGAKLKKIQTKNRMQFWTLSSACYVKDTVRIVQKHLQEKNGVQWNFPTKTKKSFAYGCELEIDEIPFKEPDLDSYYQ